MIIKTSDSCMMQFAQQNPIICIVFKCVVVLDVDVVDPTIPFNGRLLSNPKSADNPNLNPRPPPTYSYLAN